MQNNKTLTPVGGDGLGAAEEAQEPSARERGGRVAGAQPGAEVVRVQAGLLGEDGEVAGRVMTRRHPDLAQVRVGALPFRVGVGDDDSDAGQKFAALHQRDGMGRTLLHQRHTVVPERARVHVHRAGVGRGGTLKAKQVNSCREYLRQRAFLFF